MSLGCLHGYQHAYMVGSSMETALHLLVTRVERAIIAGELTMGVFIAIEGAFDNARLNL